MNLNQSAHGGREHGYINSRMKIDRKVVAGYWKDVNVCRRIDSWVRSCAAVKDQRGGRIVRFGDSMRDVAVPERGNMKNLSARRQGLTLESKISSPKSDSMPLQRPSRILQVSVSFPGLHVSL